MSIFYASYIMARAALLGDLLGGAELALAIFVGCFFPLPSDWTRR